MAGCRENFHPLNIWPDEIYGSTETGILAWRYRQQDNIPGLLFLMFIFHRKVRGFVSFRH